MVALLWSENKLNLNLVGEIGAGVPAGAAAIYLR
jgi:hypothetical protein